MSTTTVLTLLTGLSLPIEYPKILQPPTPFPPETGRQN